MKRIVIILISLIYFTSFVYAGAVTEIFEFITKKTLKQEVKESGEFAAKSIKKEITEKYGDEAGQIVSKYGDEAEDVVMVYGDDGVKIISKYNDILGDKTIMIMKKYNGVKSEMFEKYAEDIVKMDAKLSNFQVRATMEAAETGGDKVVKNMSMYGDKVIKYIEEHPKAFIGMTLAGAILIIASDEKKLAEVISPVKDVVNQTGEIGSKVVDKAGNIGLEIINAPEIRLIILLVFILLIYIILGKKIIETYRKIKNMNKEE